MPASGRPHSSQIFPEQVKLLYGGAVEAYIATAINAVLLALVQFGHIPLQIIVTWLTYMVFVTAGRTLLVVTYWRSVSRVEGADRWSRLYLVGSMLAGVRWGSAGILLYPSDSIVHQVFLAFVIGGMVAGGVAVLTPRLEIFFAFSLPAVTPIAIRVFLDGDSYHTTMTAMILLFYGALLITAYRFHWTIRSTLELRCENAELVRHLAKAKEQADALNEGLKVEIIERKAIEAALRESQEELEIRVEQRSQELQNKHEQLLQTSKLASIGELATGVAHELNNPLNNIGLITGNLLERLNEGEAPGVTSLQQNLAIVAEQVKHASEIISSLRTFGRAAGTQKGTVNLHDVLTAAVVLMDRQLRLYDVDLHLQLTDRQPLVRANAIQLEQVFVNLLTNARDAVKESVMKMVTIVTRIRDDFVETLIEDTGGGISAEDLKRIFDPFFTTKEVGQGTGLGLSISYGIIRDHGGTIIVNSTCGQGSTSTVRLPLDDGGG